MYLRASAVGLAVLVLAVVTVAQGDDAKKQEDSAKQELAKLQGKWEVAKVVFDGSATENLKGVRVVFDEDTLSLVGEEGKREFTIKLNPAKKPKAIDMTSLDGDLKDTTNPAIYELEGDVFKLCMSNEPGPNKRPSELVSKEGSKLLLMTFKRSK